MLRANHLEPKQIQLVFEKPSKNANLFLCKCVLGGKVGIEILPPVFRCDENGQESEQIKQIYNRNN